MPYINIKVTDEQVTQEQKRQLIEEVTQSLVQILHKDPKTIHIVIDEVPLGNWGVNGKQYLGTKNNKKEA